MLGRRNEKKTGGVVGADFNSLRQCALDDIPYTDGMVIGVERDRDLSISRKSDEVVLIAAFVAFRQADSLRQTATSQIPYLKVAIHIGRRKMQTIRRVGDRARDRRRIKNKGMIAIGGIEKNDTSG